MDREELERRFRAVEVNRDLGFTIRELASHKATIAMPADPRFTQETGVIQGGILTALADTTAVYAIFPLLDEGESMTGIELKINFLRGAAPGGEEIVASSSVVHRGRRTAVSEVDLRQGDRLVAKALFTFLIIGATQAK